MKIAGYTFKKPVPLGEGFECESTGIYLVLSGKEIIHVGEAAILHRTIDSKHEMWMCFQRHEDLRIAFYPMLGSTIYWREKIQQEILLELGEDVVEQPGEPSVRQFGEPACQGKFVPQFRFR